MRGFADSWFDVLGMWGGCCWWVDEAAGEVGEVSFWGIHVASFVTRRFWGGQGGGRLCATQAVDSSVALREKAFKNL